MAIETLITDSLNSEILRDGIASILVSELANQQALATAASLDPNDWRLRVFVERSNPWEQYRDGPDQSQAFPIVNISYDSGTPDMGTSNVVERQKYTTTFHIDCYGYGVSAPDGYGGHVAGDRVAAEEVHRAIRLVQQILMSAHYTYLSSRGVVWRRWIQSIQFFQPQTDNESGFHIVGARISLRVEHNEFSPQISGEILDIIGLTTYLSSTGEVLFQGDFDPNGSQVAFITQHFNIGKIGSPSVAAIPGTPDVTALAEFSQVRSPGDVSIAVIHLHGIEDKGSGTMGIEVFRRRSGVMTLLGSASVTGGGGDFVTSGFVPADPELQDGDYLFCQLNDFTGAGGYDGITVDVHFA